MTTNKKRIHCKILEKLVSEHIEGLFIQGDLKHTNLATMLKTCQPDIEVYVEFCPKNCSYCEK